jgi:hypothetical protein
MIHHDEPLENSRTNAKRRMGTPARRWSLCRLPEVGQE